MPSVTSSSEFERVLLRVLRISMVVIVYLGGQYLAVTGGVAEAELGMANGRSN